MEGLVGDVADDFCFQAAMFEHVMRFIVLRRLLGKGEVHLCFHVAS